MTHSLRNDSDCQVKRNKRQDDGCEGESTMVVRGNRWEAGSRLTREEERTERQRHDQRRQQDTPKARPRVTASSAPVVDGESDKLRQEQNRDGYGH